MSRLAAAALLAVLPFAAAAQTEPTDPTGVDLVEHPELRVYRHASELVTWCRDEAQARAVAQGHRTYQWTASHSEAGNTLSVAGKLHVGGGDFTVTCRVARGARQEFASIDMVHAAR